MSAKKQTVKKTSKNSANSKGRNVQKSRHTAVSNSGKGGRYSAPEKGFELSPRIKALIYYLIAIIFGIIIVIRGESNWVSMRNALFGFFGVCIFLIPMFFIYLAVITEREEKVNRLKTKITICLLIALFFSSFVFVIFGAYGKNQGYGECLSMQFEEAVDSVHYFPLGPGIFGGLLGYPLATNCGNVAAGLISFIMLVGLIFLIAGVSVHDVAVAASKKAKSVHMANRERARQIRERKIAERQNLNNQKPKTNYDYEQYQQYNVSDISEQEVSSDSIDIPLGGRKRKLEDKPIIQTDITQPPVKRRADNNNRIIGDGANVDIAVTDDGNATSKDFLEDLMNIIHRANKPHNPTSDSVIEDIADNISSEKRAVGEFIPDSDISADGNAVEDLYADNDTETEAETVNAESTDNTEIFDISNVNIESNNSNFNSANHSERKTDYRSDDYSERTDNKRRNSRIDDEEDDDIAELESKGYSVDGSDEIHKEEKIYHYPPIQLLRLSENNNDRHAMAEMQNNATKLIETLNSFGVKANITNICRGPSVTRYELQPAPGVKISKITNLSDDIALNLAANGVRIEAPIPGKAAVGIEVPNKVVSMVSLRELIDSDKFYDADSKLTAVLGRDISGDIVVTDLAKMPHLLIAGTTGSGKSVCVNTLLMSILYKARPDEVKLLLIDPKMVEFAKYRGIPHLLIPVVNDSKKAAGALAWAVNEMEQRYRILSEFGCKDIGSYNKLIEKNLRYIETHPPYENEEGELIQPTLEVEGLPVSKEKMCSVVIAIDELADLMMTAPGEVEDSIQRLAQKARAAGMHLILATQRPTVNVITGTIKANIPSRISLKVSSNMDSRTILDTSGGEKLIGKGDMLFLPVGAPKPMRVQGCYATDEEIEGVTAFIKKSYKAQYNAEIEETIRKIAEEEINAGKKGSDKDVDSGSDFDDLIDDAIKAVIDAGQASTSLVQRKLRVGYARAGRMIDEMEQIGVVGPHQGSKPRDVLMTYNEWLERRNILQNRKE
ncbi:MAG: DNA translocase FtsK [Ruminococcus sp.]|nr:DNA translocase FtsK [Ruminococcus sp.]